MEKKNHQKTFEVVLRKVVDVNRWYNRIEADFGVLLLFLMMFFMTFQIVQRFVFKGGNTWSEEISRYMYIWFTLVTVSYALLNNAHIKVDAFMSIFPKKIRPIIVVIGLLIIIAYSMVMIKAGLKMVLLNKEIGNISLGLKLPMWIVYFITPLCHFLIIIRGIQRLIMIYLGEDIEEVDEADVAIQAFSDESH